MTTSQKNRDWRKSLNFTPDLIVDSVEKIDEFSANLTLFTTLFPEQSEYLNNLGQQNLIFHLRSRLARFGFDFEQKKVEIIDNLISVEGVLTHIHPMYRPEDFDMYEVIQHRTAIGEIWGRNRKRRLNNDDLEKAISLKEKKAGSINIEGSSKVLPDAIRIPIKGAIVSPTELYNQGILKDIIDSKIERYDLHTYQTYDHSKMADKKSHDLSYGEGKIILLPEMTHKGLESYITHRGAGNYHTASRTAKADTYGPNFSKNNKVLEGKKKKHKFEHALEFNGYKLEEDQNIALDYIIVEFYRPLFQIDT